MKIGTHIVSPSIRTRTVSDLSSRMGLDMEQTTRLREALTPPALRHLPDHAGRGQKSLGRIQQINNRRRFKVRTTSSR